MTSQFKGPVTPRIVDFLHEIGLKAAAATLEAATFLPGIEVRNGEMFVDETRLTYPGDLLHEAGHLALATGDVRSGLHGEVALPGVAMEPVEAQAIAWSYAAAIHLELDPAIVFHEDGYFGNSASLLLSFSLGVYIGVSGLQDAGLTATGKTAQQLGVPPYPHMIKWLRD